MANPKDRILQNNSGLMAIQGLMLLICAAALIGVGIFAFLGSVHSMYQVKTNETARNVQAAAEEYLALQIRMGLLEDFNRKATYFGGAMGPKERDALFGSVYDDEQDIETAIKRYQKVEFRYILLEAEAAGKENRKDNPLIPILESAVLDEKTRGNTFLIEYNTHTGQVFSSFYSEKADILTYSGGLKERENIIARDAKSLKEKWQGYCAVNLRN